uniref:Secreted protein n=1 Tax=Cacopsylla melanoneura TaxID=428564 RepID=A0A8D8RAW0_9HEMI
MSGLWLETFLVSGVLELVALAVWSGVGESSLGNLGFDFGLTSVLQVSRFLSSDSVASLETVLVGTVWVDYCVLLQDSGWGRLRRVLWLGRVLLGASHGHGQSRCEDQKLHVEFSLYSPKHTQ